MMHWDSIGAFLTMGGHGRYVWGSYGLTLIVMVAEIIILRRRLRRAETIAAEAQEDL
jgi:heme exporter protein D